MHVIRRLKHGNDFLCHLRAKVDRYQRPFFKLVLHNSGTISLSDGWAVIVTIENSANMHKGQPAMSISSFPVFNLSPNSHWKQRIELDSSYWRGYPVLDVDISLCFTNGDSAEKGTQLTLIIRTDLPLQITNFCLKCIVQDSSFHYMHVELPR